MAFSLLSSYGTIQRQIIAKRAAEEQAALDREKDEAVKETQSRLNELHFNFTWE